MAPDSEHIRLEFHRKAGSQFQMLLEKYRQAISHLDRRRDENVFRQLEAKYLFSLKNVLDSLAKEQAAKFTSPKERNSIHHFLKEQIERYISRFRQESARL